MNESAPTAFRQITPHTQITDLPLAIFEASDKAGIATKYSATSAKAQLYYIILR